MEITMKQVMSGNFCSHVKQIVDDCGNKYDFSNSFVTPKQHHRIIVTADGFKLALNPYNGIAYKIVGEKYN